jgi:hypothetical protein
MHDIIVFKNDHPRGNAPSHLLFDKVTSNGNNAKNGETVIKRDGFDKCYTISIDGSLPIGVTLGRLLKDLWAIDN